MSAPAAGLVLAAGTVVTPRDVLSPGWVALDGGRLSAVGEGLPAPSATRRLVDLGDRLLAPGYFDVHVHGGDGAQVNGDTTEEVAAGIERLARFHARHGTTSFLATTVSASPATLLTTAAGAGGLVGRALPQAATLRGIHLEGPFLARAKLGAQDPDALRPPDTRELTALAEAAGGAVRIVTIAPELPGSHRLIDRALELGMRVAVGHSDADYETTRAAIDAGARHATHLFNAMAPLHHRRPGAVTALLLDDRVSLEVVADLEHIHPAVIALVARSGPGRLVAVSDAVAAAGAEDGNYRLGRTEVSVASGRVSLASDPATLAGSALTMDRAVQNLVSAVGLPLEAAIRAATAAPAAAAGCDGDGLGTLVAGAPADLVVLEPDLSVAATVVGGTAVFDPRGLLAG